MKVQSFNQGLGILGILECPSLMADDGHSTVKSFNLKISKLLTIKEQDNGVVLQRMYRLKKVRSKYILLLLPT